jgi:membrane protein insertase Oxa1/YidC/SpoIIIJ
MTTTTDIVTALSPMLQHRNKFPIIFFPFFLEPWGATIVIEWWGSIIVITTIISISINPPQQASQQQ